MNSQLSPVSAPVSLEKFAYDAIKEAILSFRLKPGQSLVESDLANQLAISKTPVRDALMKLQQEGLVEKIPYTGTYVAEINRQNLIDIFQIRSVLEGLATRIATNNLNETEISKLQIIIDGHAVSATNNDITAASKYNAQFHDAIIQISTNKWLAQILSNFDDHLKRYRILSNYQSDRLKKSVEEHQAVLNAMAHKDPDSAEDLMRSHLLSALEDLKNQDFDELIKRIPNQN
jgi:DNA-binding GntR family transcriptional regulator